MAPKFCGVRQKGNKYYATIRKDNVIHELGHWDTPELVARAYDTKVVEYHKEDAILNFPDCREYAKFLAPEDIRICTRTVEKENLQAEQQLFDPLVRELARDDKLLETNKMMLLQYAVKKSAEEDPIDWDKLEEEKEHEEEEEVHSLLCRRRSIRDDLEAGPSGR